MRRLILKGIVILVAVAGLATILAPQDAQACVPGTQAWCNEPERVAYYTCGGENTGTMWFNRQGGAYFTDTVSVGYNETTVPVGLRGSVWPCGNYMGNSGVWAVNVAPSGGNAWRLTGLSGTTLYRGSFQNNSWAWTTQGGTINATLNLAGIPVNNSQNPVSHSLTVDIYRCYSSNGTGVTGSCYPTPVPITVVRQGRPITWNVAPSTTITSPASVNAPNQTITWQHRITNSGDTTNQTITYRSQNQGYLGTGVTNTWTASNIANGATRQSNSTRLITQDDVGNTLCRLTTVSPRSSSNSASLPSSTACRAIPYNYNLIPSITNLAASTVIESDSKTVDVIGRVSNDGPTKSRTNVQWQLTQLRYAPGVTSIPQITGGAGGNPCSFFTGEAACAPINSGTVAAGYSFPGSATYPSEGQLNNEPAGTKICYAMSVRPYNQSTGDWRHSQLYCLIVGKKPKVQVWGGDVSVGKSRSGVPYNTSANVITSLTTKEEVSVAETAPAEMITGLWNTGVDASGNKLAANVSDPHWAIDRVYRPSGSASTCQRGYSSTGSYTSIPAAANANFQARTVIENGAMAGQYTNNTSIVGNNPHPSVTAVVGSNPWNRTSPSARWIGTNQYAQNWSSTGCNDPTRDTPGDFSNANIYAFKMRQPIVINSSINLNSVRLTVRGAMDNYVKFYINGCELRATYPTITGNWQEPGWSAGSVAGADAYVVGGASGCSTGSTGFRHGNNTFEVHIQSTYAMTGLMIDQFTATATANRPLANIYGSWGEYGIFAPASIDRMASASGLSNGGTSSAQSSWSNYSFTKKTDGTYGQYTSTKQTLPDVTTNFPTASAVVESNWNLSTTAKGRNIRPATAAPSVTLTANSGVTLGSGQWLVVNAVGKNVTIANNLTYASGPYSSARNLPQLIVIADNITINSGVTRVDAWLIARNAISTCDQQSSGSGTGQWLSSGSNYTSSSARLVIGPSGHCANVLQINGPVIANKLYLRRTAGSGPNEQAGNPAEIINLRPDAYLWANEWMNPLRAYRTTNVTELPPRY